MELKEKILDGTRENPMWLVFLGACPALAATKSVLGALVMGMSLLCVLVLSDLILSLLKGLLSDKGRLAVGVLVITFLAAAADMLVHALAPAVYAGLGYYVALLGIDLMIVSSALDFAGHNKLGAALSDGFIWGIRFVLLVLVVGAIREIFGAGSFAGFEIPGLSDYNIPLLQKAPGAFFALAFGAAIFSGLKPAAREGEEDKFAAMAAGVEEE